MNNKEEVTLDEAVIGSDGEIESVKCSDGSVITATYSTEWKIDKAEPSKS